MAKTAKNDPLVQLNLKVPASLLKALRAEKNRSGVPVSEFIRRAARARLEEIRHAS